MTEEEWEAARPVPRTITIRRALKLSQEEFAARWSRCPGRISGGLNAEVFEATFVILR